MKITPVIFLLFISASGFSQSLKDSLFDGKLIIDTGKIVSLKKEESKKETYSEIDASFPGGDEAWMNYLTEVGRNIADSAKAHKVPKAFYSILVRFIVGKDGSPQVVDIVCNPANSYIEEKCRYLISTAPKWSPSYQNGKYVKEYRTQPLYIRIR